MPRSLALATDIDTFLSSSLWSLFEKQALECGDCPAILEGANRWTYSELRERSLEVALRLEPILAGRRGVRVAVDVGLNAGTAASILGILRAGGIAVPMDTAHPASYRREVLEDAAAAVHLDGASGKVLSTFPSPSFSDGDFSVGDLSEIALLLWTSGSTSRPKGVAVPGRSLALEAWNCIRAYGFVPLERVGWTASPTFAGAMAAFFSTLLGGAALVPADLRTLGLAGAGEWLERERVTAFRPPVSFYRQWIRPLSRETVPKDLRIMTLGGQALHWMDIADFLERFPEDRVFVHRYACTEAGLLAHAFFGGGAPAPLGEESVPLGKCPEGVTAVILGEDGEPLPAGATGEISIMGRGLAAGYWKRPDLTRDRFVERENGERLYRTGDLGHLSPDGTLFLEGRIDGQLKIRGFRVEPARVEEALREIPGIEDAIVRTWAPPASPEEQVLVGVVVPAEGSRPTADGLRRSLSARLPDYMIPGRFLVVGELPRTPGGKVDRSRLPEPQPERPGLTVPFVSPEGSVEQSLARLWEDVLGIRPIGVLDDFFDLGGHSVQAARLFGQLERTFGVRLPLAELYRGRTIREMAALLARNEESRWSSIVPIRTGTGGDALFFVHAVGGNAIGFGPLADRLPGYDVYGIQAWGLHPRHFPHLSVEEMAAHYIREMRGIQHEGPYRVSGYSFGGVVAYEMARQLEAAGEEVAFLGLLDRVVLRMEHARTLKDGVLHFWNDTTRRVKLALRIPAARLLLALGLPVPFMHRIATGAIKRMGATYFPKSPYGGAMDLFMVERPAGVIKDPALAWSHAVTGPIRVHAVAGTHQTMLEEPHVDVLAESLLKALRQSMKNHLGG